MYLNHLKKISRTSQYDFDRSNYLRLDANERVIPFKTKEIENIKKIITSELIQSYPPSNKSLIKLISKKEKINEKFITLVAGSDTALKYLFEVFNKKKKKIVSIFPTYGMLSVYSRIYKYKLKNISESKFEENIISKDIIKNCSFIYLANPNQPSGNIINYHSLINIIKKANKQKIHIVIDEAYIDFTNQKSCSNLVKKYKYLIVLKSLSKSIGIAGLRLGYVISNPQIKIILDAVKPIFDITGPSIKICEFFFKNKKILENYLQEIKKSKNFVERECAKRQLKFKLTNANFFHIFFEKGNKVKNIVKKLKHRKILIKSKYSKGFNVLKNSIRITYGSRSQMSTFFNELDKIQ